MHLLECQDQWDQSFPSKEPTVWGSALMSATEGAHELTCPDELTPPKYPPFRGPWSREYNTIGYPILIIRREKFYLMILNETTYNRTRNTIHRTTKQPKFMSPRAVKLSLRFSSVLYGSTSGLWMSSSGSTRSGDKSDPQSLGSGDKENFETHLQWVEKRSRLSRF